MPKLDFRNSDSLSSRACEVQKSEKQDPEKIVQFEVKQSEVEVILMPAAPKLRSIKAMPQQQILNMRMAQSSMLAPKVL